MNTVTKSPRKVAAVALETAERTLPKYSSNFSRKDFTLPQLFTCLVLKQFFKTDYRGIVAILADMPALQKQMGLKKVPHFASLSKVEAKLLTDERVKSMLTEQINLFFELPETKEGQPRHSIVIEQAAIDSTGLQHDQASRYFVKRVKGEIKKDHEGKALRQVYTSYSKLGIVVCCGTHFILSMLTGVGPKPDTNELVPTFERLPPNVVIEQLLADAGYDSESNHEVARERWQMESVMPPLVGRPIDKLPTGKYRYLMVVDFPEEDYGQRWQVETVNYQIKRHLGDTIAARGEDARLRELSLKGLSFNFLRMAA